MLDVTGYHLECFLRTFHDELDSELQSLSDGDAFKFLDQRIYGDDDRSMEQIARDSVRFRKYDFLTNGGESFDRGKSFAVPTGQHVRILFREGAREFESGCISNQDFLSVVQDFRSWLELERKSAG